MLQRDVSWCWNQIKARKVGYIESSHCPVILALNAGFTVGLESLQVEYGQLNHVTNVFGSQPISKGKCFIRTNQIRGIQKDR